MFTPYSNHVPGFFFASLTLASATAKSAASAASGTFGGRLEALVRQVHSI